MSISLTGNFKSRKKISYSRLNYRLRPPRLISRLDSTKSQYKRSLPHSSRGKEGQFSFLTNPVLALPLIRFTEVNHLIGKLTFHHPARFIIYTSYFCSYASRISSTICMSLSRSKGFRRYLRCGPVTFSRDRLALMSTMGVCSYPLILRMRSISSRPLVSGSL